jgi:carboxyl-terminal processing protease
MDDKQLSYRRSIFYGVALGMVMALVFAGGLFFRDWIDQTQTPSRASGMDYALLDEVQGLLDRHYLRPQPEYTQREYAAIRGMLQTLGDPFTFFIDPPVAASESDALAGTYGGIGVDIVRSEAGELVLYPFADSPALAAGIAAGDLLREVNDTPVDLSLSQDALNQLLRGEVRDGNGVNLRIQKGDTGEEIIVFVPFAVINVPSVSWRVLEGEPRIGYVKITLFTGRTPDELNTGLTELQAAGVQALIIDLRNNTGGLLQESIQVADAFVDDGVLVYEQNVGGEIPHNGEAGGLGIDLPLIVLVNHMTASGAELVAGAIQDTDRGLLIGQRTYGKGTVQQIFPLSDQSSLHVTASEWFTPARTPLQGQGLTPDTEMIPDSNGRDVELGEAIRVLQNEL